jgi:serine/threonine protein phosphatase PrpC
MAAVPQDEVTPRVTLEAWLVTDVGVVRDHNEDSAFMERDKGFFIVADGMGGHAAGEVASAMAVETVRKTLESAHTEINAFKKAPSDAGRRGLVQLLQNAVLSAHQAVFQRGQNEQDKAGMGTTLDVVLIAGPEAFVAHVGDSRTYLIREGRSSQITTDHTVAEVLVIEGKLTIEEAQVSPLRTILVNAIGVSADVGVEMAHVTLKRGDRILLCSDGLHDYFPVEEEIAQKLSAETPGSALADMVELAKTRGGHDNITGVAVQVLEIVDAVPAQMEGESTHPVDSALNPFADEPTETAFLAPPGLPPRMVVPSQPLSKDTQPMRAVDDGAADTIPPADLKALGERATDPKLPAVQPGDADAKPDEAKPADAPKAPKGAKSAKDKAGDSGDKPSPAKSETGDKPVSDKGDKPVSDKGDKPAADKGDKPAADKPTGDKPTADKADKPSTDKGDKPKATADAKSDKEDAAPTEIGTADTGRVQVPKDKGAS